MSTAVKREPSRCGSTDTCATETAIGAGGAGGGEGRKPEATPRASESCCCGQGAIGLSISSNGANDLMLTIHGGIIGGAGVGSGVNGDGPVSSRGGAGCGGCDVTARGRGSSGMSEDSIQLPSQLIQGNLSNDTRVRSKDLSSGATLAPGSKDFGLSC